MAVVERLGDLVGHTIDVGEATDVREVDVHHCQEQQYQQDEQTTTFYQMRFYAFSVTMRTSGLNFVV